MADWVCDGPISVPLRVAGVEPDVDLGGLKFSYEYGMFYTPETEIKPLKLPSAPDRGR